MHSIMRNVGEGEAHAAKVGSVGECAEVMVDDLEEVEQLRQSMPAHVGGGVAQDVSEEEWEAGVLLYELLAFHFVPFPDR